MLCKNCSTELYGEFCSKCGTKNIPETEEKDINDQQQQGTNRIMAYVNKHFADTGCQNAAFFVSEANFIPFLYRISALIASITFIYGFIQNFNKNLFSAIFLSALASAVLTYIIAVIINGTFYEHKYYNLCLVEYIAKGNPLNPESIRKFMEDNITLPEFTDWSCGYNKDHKCGYVGYTFKGDEKHTILLFPNRDRFEVQIDESYTKTYMFGTFLFKQAKYYNNLKTAKTVIVLAMNYYLENM